MIRRDNDNCHRRAARGLRVIIQMGLLTSRWSRGHEYSDVSDANYGTNERRGPGACDQAGDHDHGRQPGSLTSSRHLLISTLWPHFTRAPAHCNQHRQQTLSSLYYAKYQQNTPTRDQKAVY